MNRRRFLLSASSFCSLAGMGQTFATLQQESALKRRVRAQLDCAIADELTVGAVVMVVYKGEVEVFDAAGYADRDSRKPMQTDAIFDIRSLCKPITVLGALLLVQDGKLTLDGSLSTILPDFSHLKVAGQDEFSAVPITIRQLMTHTS